VDAEAGLTDGIDTAGTGGVGADGGVETGGADGGTDLTDVLQNTPVEDTRDREAARAAVKAAEAALARGDLSKARAAYERAINHDDRYAAPHDGLCRLEFHRGKYAKAARHGEKAVRMAARDATMRIHLGDAYYKAYRYDRAKAQYAKAKELGDSRADARLKKAEAKLGG
jgi:tetratricopeptide (TPR) repeat protein